MAESDRANVLSNGDLILLGVFENFSPVIVLMTGVFFCTMLFQAKGIKTPNERKVINKWKASLNAAPTLTDKGKDGKVNGGNDPSLSVCCTFCISPDECINELRKRHPKGRAVLSSQSEIH